MTHFSTTDKIQIKKPRRKCAKMKAILKKEVKENKGITLIALVITIIILLILAGISIATLTGENGILSKAEIAKQKTEEATAREILETSLLSASANKYTTNEYNQNEWLNEHIIAQNPNDTILIDGDIFTVNGWKFLVDRNVPKIVEGLGQASRKGRNSSDKSFNR